MSGSSRPWAWRVVRWAVRLSPALLVVWLGWQNTAPLGNLTLRCTVDGCDPRVRNFASKEERVTITTPKDLNDSFRVITVDPLYFDVDLLRPMTRASVSLVYQNPDGQPRLKVGVQGSGSAFEYAPFPIYSPLYTYLEERWEQVRENGNVLFIRPEDRVRRFGTLQEFLRAARDLEDVATVNFGSGEVLPLPDYKPESTPRRYDVSIRGAHTFEVYVGAGEPLDVRFAIQDINRHAGRDDVTIRVLRGSDVIKSLTVRDDGETRPTGRPSAEREAHLRVEQTTEGVYHVRVSTKDDDPFIRSIVTPQHLFKISDGRFYLAGSSEYRILGRTDDTPLTVYYQGTRLTLSTSHPRSLQTVRVGSRLVTLRKVNQPVTVTFRPSQQPIPITVPARDILLEGNGAFALARDDFFTTDPLRLVTGQNELADVNYVLAQEPVARPEGSSYVSTAILDLPRRRNLSFTVIGDPPLGGSGRELLLKEVSVRFTGPALTPRTLYGLFRDLVRRIRTTNPLQN